MIKYYSYIKSGNKTAFRNPDIDSGPEDAFSINNLNTYQNINWRDNLGNGWRLNAGIGSAPIRHFSSMNCGCFQQQDPDHNPHLLMHSKFPGAEPGLACAGTGRGREKLNRLNTIRFGSDYFYSKEKNPPISCTTAPGFRVPWRITWYRYSPKRIYIYNSLAANWAAGSSIRTWLVNGTWPHVPPSPINSPTTARPLLPTGCSTRTERRYLPALASLDYSRAAYYILQYQKQTSQRTFRVEAFYKSTNLYKTTVSLGGQEAASSNNGFGDAKGVELSGETGRHSKTWITGYPTRTSIPNRIT